MGGIVHKHLDGTEGSLGSIEDTQNVARISQVGFSGFGLPSGIAHALHDFISGRGSVSRFRLLCMTLSQISWGHFYVLLHPTTPALPTGL